MNKIIGKIFQKIAEYFKKDCMEVLGREYNLASRFSTASLPREVKGFEDLSFLFWSSPLNRGLIRMDLDEAAYLFKLVRSLKVPFCVEIGRFKGGSTFLLAAAMEGGRLLSIDYHQKMMLKTEGRSYDDELRSTLKTYGLESTVDLAMADSGKYPNNNISADLIFIDGDHTYEGVRRDYEHWLKSMKRGSHIIFHDAAASRAYATIHDGVKKLAQELEGNVQSLIKVSETGSLVHFKLR